MNDPLAELEAGKRVINDMFRDLLIGKKAFKYQITKKVMGNSLIQCFFLLSKQ